MKNMVLKHILRLVGRPLLASLCQNTCAFVVVSDIISRYGVECVESYSAIKFDVACNPCSNLVCSSKLIYCMRRVLYLGFVRNFCNNTGLLEGLWGSTGLWWKMGLLGGLWGSTGVPLGLNWVAPGLNWVASGGSSRAFGNPPGIFLPWRSEGPLGVLGALLGLWWPRVPVGLWGPSWASGTIWRILVAPWASGGSWRPLGPLAALGGSCLLGASGSRYWGPKQSP